MSDTVAGAMIGASVALIGMVVAKEGSISTLRQQWIDGLRTDVAKIISLVLHVTGTTPNPSDFLEINESLARVALRLNPKEETSQAVIKALNGLRDAAEAKNPDLQPLAEDAVQKTQVILKSEWRRVKRGEWRYVAILVAATVALVCGTAVAGHEWFRAHISPHLHVTSPKGAS